MPDGSTLTTPALKRARLAGGRQNKTCTDCGLTCHPVRTACPKCGGTLIVPPPATPVSDQTVANRIKDED